MSTMTTMTKRGSATQVMLAGLVLLRNMLNINMVCARHFGQSITCVALPLCGGLSLKTFERRLLGQDDAAIRQVRAEEIERLSYLVQPFLIVTAILPSPS